MIENMFEDFIEKSKRILIEKMNLNKPKVVDCKEISIENYS